VLWILNYLFLIRIRILLDLQNVPDPTQNIHCQKMHLNLDAKWYINNLSMHFYKFFRFKYVYFKYE
jgi:hypothetical protein